jgi:hypothetical protein
MKTRPWVAIDLFTSETLGNYASEFEAWSANRNRAVDVFYRPNAREVK